MIFLIVALILIYVFIGAVSVCVALVGLIDISEAKTFSNAEFFLALFVAFFFWPYVAIRFYNKR